MKVKIYEGRIYSVVKEKDGNICVETLDGLQKNDAEFKKGNEGQRRKVYRHCKQRESSQHL